MKISVCLIVKNEEEKLGRCLESIIDYVDEIIITDTGSDDATVEIAKKYTDKIYFFEWIHDFSAARNFCQSHASGNYILWMDADEWFETSDIKALIETLKENSERELFSCSVIGKKNGKLISSGQRTIAIKNNGKYSWKWKVHEIIDTKSNNYEYGESMEIHEIAVQHEVNMQEKYWNDFNYLIHNFANDTDNSRVSLIILGYFLERNNRLQIEKHLHIIPYIHRRFLHDFLLLRRTLEKKGFHKEMKILNTIIARSVLQQKKLHK